MPAYSGHMPSLRAVRSQHGLPKQADIACSKILADLSNRQRAEALWDPRIIAEQSARIERSRQYAIGQWVKVPMKCGVVRAQIVGIASVTGSIEVSVPRVRGIHCFTADVIDEHNGVAQEPSSHIK